MDKPKYLTTKDLPGLRKVIEIKTSFVKTTEITIEKDEKPIESNYVTTEDFTPYGYTNQKELETKAEEVLSQPVEKRRKRNERTSEE